MQLQKHHEIIQDLMCGHHTRLTKVANKTLDFMQDIIKLVIDDNKTEFKHEPIAIAKFQAGARYTYTKVAQLIKQGSNIRIRKGELLQTILKKANKLMQLEIDEIRVGRDEQIAKVIADLTAAQLESDGADLKSNTRTAAEEEALAIARLARDSARHFTATSRYTIGRVTPAPSRSASGAPSPAASSSSSNNLSAASSRPASRMSNGDGETGESKDDVHMEPAFITPNPVSSLPQINNSNIPSPASSNSNASSNTPSPASSNSSPSRNQRRTFTNNIPNGPIFPMQINVPKGNSDDPDEQTRLRRQDLVRPRNNNGQ